MKGAEYVLDTTFLGLLYLLFDFLQHLAHEFLFPGSPHSDPTSTLAMHATFYNSAKKSDLQNLHQVPIH